MTSRAIKANLLVVDDDPVILDLIRGELEPQGYNMFCVGGGREALNVAACEEINLAILDYSLPDICGADLFHQLRAAGGNFPVIFLTGHPNLETAVALMKHGVRDYLTKPFDLEKLSSYIRDVLGITRSPTGKAEGEVPTAGDGWLPGGYFFGTSEAMRRVDTQIRNLPRYPNTTVLITGPTGTGKSVVARRIHELSCENKAPFVEIDCSTIPRELCESELFGHEKGSFTGAHRTKPGLFEAAGNGTAFLDEIGELELSLQSKFLHVLEAREFKRVGGHDTHSMSARIIAATNRSLPELVRTGRFREDLFFRLNVFELWMPPLKERAEDVLALAHHFLALYAARYEKEINGFTPEALAFLKNCEFPGNIRELRNMIERAVISTNSSSIQFANLVCLHRPPAPPPEPAPAPPVVRSEPVAPLAEKNGYDSGPLNLATLEREKLVEALAAANGNKSKAARMVGLSRTAFHRRLQKYGLVSSQTDSGVLSGMSVASVAVFI